MQSNSIQLNAVEFIPVQAKSSQSKSIQVKPNLFKSIQCSSNSIPIQLNKFTSIRFGSSQHKPMQPHSFHPIGFKSNQLYSLVFISCQVNPIQFNLTHSSLIPIQYHSIHVSQNSIQFKLIQRKPIRFNANQSK